MRHFDLVAAARDLVVLDLTLESTRAAAERKSGPPASVAVLDGDGFRFADPGVCTPVAGAAE
jgi:hypothetical protein